MMGKITLVYIYGEPDPDELKAVLIDQWPTITLAITTLEAAPKESKE